MRREYHKWFSPRLQRDMELLVFGHAGARVLVFPTRCARFYEYEDLGLVHTLRGSIEGGYLQLYCVDSIDGESLYCQTVHPAARISRHIQYEEYLLNEVLPLTQDLNPNPIMIAHGCSLGAFHAVNIAFRHPHLFGKVVALSGRYDLTLATHHFRSLFDGHYDDNIYFHTPSHFLPNLSDPHILGWLQRMEIILAVGEQDQFCENNRQLSTRLWEKGISHALHLWEGEAHRVRYWRQMVGWYL